MITREQRKEREDFAARVRGDHPDDKAWKRYVVGELRLAHRRAMLHEKAIAEAIDMIARGVDPELALSAIGDALDYMIPMPPEPDTSDIPEASEEWFRNAKLIMPEEKE